MPAVATTKLSTTSAFLQHLHFPHHRHHQRQREPRVNQPTPWAPAAALGAQARRKSAAGLPGVTRGAGRSRPDTGLISTSLVCSRTAPARKRARTAKTAPKRPAATARGTTRRAAPSTRRSLISHAATQPRSGATVRSPSNHATTWAGRVVNLTPFHRKMHHRRGCRGVREGL